MAYATATSQPGFGIAAIVKAALEGVRAARARAKVERDTFDALSYLNERELEDIGMARGDIPDVARKAAEQL